MPTSVGLSDKSPDCAWRAELTFIICVPNASPGGAQVPTGVEPDALTMIGDVNMFLKGPADDPEFEVEVEIMIAGRHPPVRESLPHISPASPHASVGCAPR